MIGLRLRIESALFLCSPKVLKHCALRPNDLCDRRVVRGLLTTGLMEAWEKCVPCLADGAEDDEGLMTSCRYIEDFCVIR